MVSKMIIQEFINTFKTCNSYDKLFRNLTVVSAGEGNIKCTIPVLQEHLNGLGTMHGGCVASLVDTVSTFGLVTGNVDGKLGVSVNMAITYVNPAKLGDVITIESSALKTNGLLRSADVVIRNQQDKLIAKGTHMKAMK